ncbi:MAG: hypothetical protein Q8J89_09980 [Caulobacter sp.]|nr:hypothetical protein [Caulobacter sp.]
MTTRVTAAPQTALEDYEDFLDLLRQLTPDRRRIIDALLRKIAAVEDADGESAALSLIEDVSSILATTPTTH